MKKIFILASIFCLNAVFSQSSWKKIKLKTDRLQNANYQDKKRSLPKVYDIYTYTNNSTFNLASRNNLKVITLPINNGEIETFTLKETSYFEKELAEKYPNIKSYSAIGTSNPELSAKISFGADGMHAMIQSKNTETYYIDTFNKTKNTFIAYNRSDAKQNVFECNVESQKRSIEKRFLQKRNLSDGKLRTYRIAIGATNEYSKFHVNIQGASSNDPEYIKKEIVMSAINTTITRVNSIYERDLAIRLVIVANNDKLIFTNFNMDDGLSNSNANALLDESQKLCDNIIGSSNYDIGHTFSTGGGGLASLGSVCQNGFKAKGITGSPGPYGDAFNVDFVSHEIGHQFGAEHTFSGEGFNCTTGSRSKISAVEPGSGSTIMGYAGICGNIDIQQNSDAYFNAASIQQITENVLEFANCSKITETGNTAPLADAGKDYYVPKSTPLVLRGNAIDKEDNSRLTYCWEQNDNIKTEELDQMDKLGPLFRSFYPSKSSVRYLPAFSTVVNGLRSEWEQMANLPRRLNFNLTVRDNNPLGGATDTDTMIIDVTDSDPFTVTSQNTENVVWYVDSKQQITWNKGLTSVAPINCKYVNIKLSVDGGKSFPITLAQNTPNDGNELVTVPNNISSNARILIEAVDNIFYNVNAIEFAIEPSTNTFVMNNTSTAQSICNLKGNSVTYVLETQYLKNFNETVRFSAANIPTGASVSFSPELINSSNKVNVTVSNIENSTIGENYFKIIGNTDSGASKSIELKLTIINSDLQPVLLSEPQNNVKNIELNTVLSWEGTTDATTYNVQLASDSGFTNLIHNEIVKKPYFVIPSQLNVNSTYYWRVKQQNVCNESDFSETFNFTTKSATYCSSTFTKKTNNSEYIKNVTFNTINNSSGNKVTNGYEDFTNISTAVKPGDNYDLIVTFDIAGFQDHCFAFFDWNQDYQFSKEETYDLSVIYSEDNFDSLIKTITIPKDAKIGKTRMRIVIEYFDDNTSYGEGACDSDQNTYELGETEDYTIIVGDSTSSVESVKVLNNFKLYPNPTSNLLNIEFSTPSKKDVFINIYDLTGRVIKQLKFNNRYSAFNKRLNIKQFNAGIYLIEIIHDNRKLIKKLLIK